MRSLMAHDHLMMLLCSNGPDGVRRGLLYSESVFLAILMILCFFFHERLRETRKRNLKCLYVSVRFEFLSFCWNTLGSLNRSQTFQIRSQLSCRTQVIFKFRFVIIPKAHIFVLLVSERFLSSILHDDEYDTKL